MLKFLADENFDNTIVRGLFRRNPTLDIVRVQDIGLSGKLDAPENEVVQVMLRLAAGEETQASIVQWLGSRCSQN